ncbi:hypothetical protein RV11_GL003008 [Enterococcus phoeniculicola]|nr:hypothetical protein RV11_GL003008 [Enterococcus phoeniculicola]
MLSAKDAFSVPFCFADFFSKMNSYGYGILKKNSIMEMKKKES